MSATVWMVVVGQPPDKVVFSIRGIFDNRDAAIAACTDEADFITPFELNKVYEGAVTEAPYYPHLPWMNNSYG